jgi:HAD superfamily hydrolase (TIGR01509 family)
MIKAIIFDFYDVIYYGTVHSWLNKYGLERKGEIADVFNQVDAGTITTAEFYENLAKFAGLSAEEARKTFEVDGAFDLEVIEIIRQLKNSYKIGLISNAQSNYLRHLLEQNNFIDLFDELVISSEVGYIKPSREIFEIALSKLDVNANEAVFIDDIGQYVEAAKSLGITSLQFKGAKKLREDLRALEII